MKSEETKGITAMMILEIIGKPAEHLIKTLEGLIKQIDEEKGVKVLSKKISEAKPLEKHPGFFTTFAEVEVEVEEVLYVALLMFKYMPAHVEIIAPELIALTNNGWSEILSELTRRLHAYDEVTRNVQMEKAILEKKLREVLGQVGEKQASDVNDKKKPSGGRGAQSKVGEGSTSRAKKKGKKK